MLVLVMASVEVVRRRWRLISNSLATDWLGRNRTRRPYYSCTMWLTVSECMGIIGIPVPVVEIAIERGHDQKGDGGRCTIKDEQYRSGTMRSGPVLANRASACHVKSTDDEWRDTGRTLVRHSSRRDPFRFVIIIP
jgi:hypothetical protein